MTSIKFSHEDGSDSNSDFEDQLALQLQTFYGQQQSDVNIPIEISKGSISPSTPEMWEILSRPLAVGNLVDASYFTSDQASNIGATSMMDQSSSRISEPGFIEPKVIAAYQRMEQKTSIERISGNSGRLSNLSYVLRQIISSTYRM